MPALTTCLAAYLSANLPLERLNVVMGSYVSATVAGGASYVLAALFAWKTGIGAKPRQAPRFYIAMAAATIAAMALALSGFSAVELLVGSSVLNGLLAPPLMVIILHIANNDHIMAGHTNTRLMNVLGIVATLIMGLSAIALLGQLLMSAIS